MMDQLSGSSISSFRSHTKHVHDFQLPVASRAASSRVISPIAPMWCLRCEWLVSRSFLRFALLSRSGVHLATFEGSDCHDRCRSVLVRLADWCGWPTSPP